MPVVRAGQRRRVPGVRPVRLGAVALLGQLGRLHGAVGGGRERLDGRPRPDRTRASPPGRTPTRCAPRPATSPPADGLHYRWPDLPSLRIESRLHAKLDAVRAFARVNTHRPRHRDREPAGDGRHRHLRQGALRPDGGAAPPRHLARRARRRRRAALQGGPALSARADAHRTRSPRACDEILVVEEKGAGRRERSCATCSTTRRRCGRRSSASTTRAAGRWCRALGELRPSRLIELVADWLAAHFPAARPAPPGARLHAAASCSRNDGDAVKRLPYFCAGCPHNTAPRCPRARARRPASAATSWRSWMDRDTEGLIQMGGEGVDWVSHAMFTKVPHVFQNLGDGTYYHSGYLAIRQAIAAKANDHLQDPLQRRGRDDRRPAGRRHHQRRRASRARSRPKA